MGLKQLFVDNNRLQALPETVGRLIRLESLDAGRNQLRQLPESIRGLSALQLLELSDNQLESLPMALGDLGRLAMLNLCNNQLTSLPDSIGRLSRLAHLDVSDNRIDHLPDSVGQMAALNTLLVARNHLRALPDALGQATALDTVIASHNQITELSDALCGLENLAELDVDSNQLSTLPAGISQLEGLERLVLARNRFETIPPAVRDLEGCEVWLAENPFSPGEVERFTAEPATAFLIFDESENRADRVAMPLISGINRWRDVIPDLPEAEWHRSDQTHARHFGGWLAQLLETREFEHEETRVDLVARVKSMLAQMAESPALRETLFHVAHEATASCIDNVMLGLNNMEMACQNHLAAEGRLSEQDVFGLGVRMFRMKQLSRIAQAHVADQEQAGRVNDPVEVHLAFQVGLRERLSLPVGTQTMQFSQLANVRDSQLERAADEVEQMECEPPRAFIEHYDQTLATLTSGTTAILEPAPPRHALALHLAADYGPWGEHVSRRHAGQVEDQTAAMHRYLEQMEARNREGKMSESEFLQANNAAKFYATEGVAYRRALDLIAEQGSVREPENKRARVASPAPSTR